MENLMENWREELNRIEVRRASYKTLFSRGLDPKRLMFMKPEFRGKFANELKRRLSDEFPTVKIEANKDLGLIFKSPSTRVYFNNDSPTVEYWSPLENDWNLVHDDDTEDDWDGVLGMYDWDIESILISIYKNYKDYQEKTLKEKALKEKGQGVRNAELTGALTGLPHGPESRVATMLSGIEGKNAYQQGDILKRSYGVQGPDPDRKQYSGRRKTLRRKNLRSSRKNK
jgi:hypothetical protein